MELTQLVYYPKANFNDVLIILREPHIKRYESFEEAFQGNRRWFEHVISDRPMTGNMKWYKDRFIEMLLCCDKYDLSSIAFTNINLAGGGKSASREYWKMDKAPILFDIIDSLRPKTVFLLKELFNIIAKDSPTESGIEYGNGKVLRSARIHEIQYFEIYHPCYRFKIKHHNQKAP